MDCTQTAKGGSTKVWVKLIGRIIIFSLLGWFLLDFNPFGISDKADLATQNAAYKVLAPYYRSEAKQDIVIVLINQMSINDLYQRKTIEANEWPIRYRDHAVLISKMLQHEPHAVFVDFYFKQERSTDSSFKQFQKKLNRLSARYDAPIFFAGGYHDEDYTDFQRKLSELGEFVVTGGEGYEVAYPLVDGGLQTASYRLYQHACQGSSPLASCQQPLISNTHEGDAISVRWGSSPGRVVFPEFSKELCPPVGNSVLEVGRQMLFGFSKGLVSYEEARPADAKCGYHSIIYADDMAYIDKLGTPEQKERLDEALRNKIIIYGLSLEGLHDNVDSPVHGQLPGVFLHAMALDNMMYYGADYIRGSDDKIRWISQSVWVAMVVIFSILLMYFEGKGVNFGASDQTESQAPQMPAWVMFAVPALLIITISAVMFVGLRYEPLNSIDFLVLIGVSSWLIRSDFVERLLEKLYGVFGIVKDRMF